MTAQDIKARVSRGAALLDAQAPGWAAQIDLGRLDLSCCWRCILGQLSGSFELGMRRYLGTYEAAKDHGFERREMWVSGVVVSESEFIRAKAAEYRALQDCWVTELAQRLVVPSAVPDVEIVSGSTQ